MIHMYLNETVRKAGKEGKERDKERDRERRKKRKIQEKNRDNEGGRDTCMHDWQCGPVDFPNMHVHMCM